MTSYLFDPIGVVRSPFTERLDAPRQPDRLANVAATIELFPGRGYEDALDGLQGWTYAWVVFVFHRNVEQARGWRAKVLPPRSRQKRGVFSTRSPHRPNPIGLSAVRIDRVEGCVVHVLDIDLLDGTPVLDLKPYVPYTDAHPDARSGWLEAPDPLLPWEVVLADDARARVDWLRMRGVELQGAIESALALGPQPHAYRRIRAHGSGMRLALKDWRVDFAPVGGDGRAGPLRRIVVRSLWSGYRPSQLAGDPALAVHADFVATWGVASPSEPRPAR
jgi:tRNA-Thr(GGU) m(6)t(6)A37 methyltransferase TsaA